MSVPKITSILLVIMVLAMVNSQQQGEYSLTELISGMSNYVNITFKITDKLISIRGGCNIQTGYFNVS